MEKSSKRGKIPQKDWPLIIKRYESGETLAAIARTYDCSPPAISYVLSRSRARDATGDGVLQNVIEPSEPDLMQTVTSEARASIRQGEPGEGGTNSDFAEAEASIPVQGLDRDRGPPSVEPTGTPNGQPDAPDERSDVVAAEANAEAQQVDKLRHSLDPAVSGNPNGSIDRPAAPFQNDDPRRTLHLSRSQHGTHRPDLQSHGIQTTAARAARSQPLSATVSGRQHIDYRSAANNSGTFRTGAEELNQTKENGAFIDRALRERVDEDIATFLAAFDAALADDSPESRAGLRAATDRLLRAGARTRIELERLEARVPLPSRESGGHPVPTWRPR
jgi:hypothetical protein